MQLVIAYMYWYTSLTMIPKEFAPSEGDPEYPERDVIDPKTYAPTGSSSELEIPVVRIDFSEGINPFGTPFDADSAKILAGVKEKIWSEQRHYPDPARLEQIRDRLRERAGLTTAGVFVFGGGSDRGLSDVITRDIADDAMVIGLGPHFPGARNLAVQRGNPDGYKAIQPPSMTLDEGIRMVATDPDFLRGGIVVYTSHPGTPTGEVAPPEMLEDLVARANFHKNLVVLDMAFGAGLPLQETGIPLTEKYDNLIVLTTLSKDIGMPGAGIGIGYFSKDRADRFEKLLLPYPLRGSGLVIAEEVILTKRWDSFLPKNTEQIVAAKRGLVNMLDRESIQYLPTDLRTLPITIEGTDDMLQRDLLREFGIKTAGGEGFDPTHKDLSNRFIRVIVQTPQKNRKLVEALVALRDKHLELPKDVRIRVLQQEVPLFFPPDQDDRLNAPV